MPCGCQALTPRRAWNERIAREGKSMTAVTHLAWLGVKEQDAAFWVQRITKDERAAFRGTGAAPFMSASREKFRHCPMGWGGYGTGDS